MPLGPATETHGCTSARRHRPKSRVTRRTRRRERLPQPPEARNTAVVYCEGNFGAGDGKTANGLVRHSEKYQILSVIDSTKAGLDAGEVLGDAPNGIPICADLADGDRLGGPRPRLLHLRDGALQRDALARRAPPGARGDRARDAHRQRPPRVPERRPRVRRGGRGAQRDDPRRAASAREEEPADVLAATSRR